MSDPLRWRLDDDPPEAGDGRADDPAPSPSEPIDRDDRAAMADSLAAAASADPEADPLGGAEHRGGYGMGCSPQSSNPGNILGSAERANL